MPNAVEKVLARGGFHKVVGIEFKSQWVEECLQREKMDQINIDNPFEKSGYEGEKKLRIGQKKKKNVGRMKVLSYLFIYLF